MQKTKELLYNWTASLQQNRLWKGHFLWENSNRIMFSNGLIRKINPSASFIKYLSVVNPKVSLSWLKSFYRVSECGQCLTSDISVKTLQVLDLKPAFARFANGARSLASFAACKAASLGKASPTLPFSQGKAAGMLCQTRWTPLGLVFLPKPGYKYLAPLLFKGEEDRVARRAELHKYLFHVGPLMKHLGDQTGRGALPQPSSSCN